jgi:hypothetical protein
MQDEDAVSWPRMIIGGTLVALICLAFVITSGWEDPDALWRVWAAISP